MNPTAFLSKTGLGIGLFAQDDVYTVQSKASFNTGKIELLSDSFVLNNNANYTLEWTIIQVQPAITTTSLTKSEKMREEMQQ
jgi:hypothetical protein